MATEEESVQYTADARQNMKGKALGFGADNVAFFAHTSQGNDSSNSAAYLEQNAQDARRRIGPTAMGLSAGSAKFFEETNQGNPSSSDPKHNEQMFNEARNKFS